jgi:hypothetical protein
LRWFGIDCGDLVYIFRFGMVYPVQSGNPVQISIAVLHADERGSTFNQLKFSK